MDGCANISSNPPTSGYEEKVSNKAKDLYLDDENSAPTDRMDYFSKGVSLR